METLNTKKNSWNTRLLFVSLMFVVSSVVVGCGEDKKSGTTVATSPDVTRIGHPNCTSCATYTDEITTAFNVSMDGGTDMAIALFSPTTTNTTAYTGPVDVGGYLNIISTSISECPVATGFYRLRVASPNGTYADNHSATWNLTNLSLEAVHDNGTVLSLYIPHMEFYDDQQIVGADGYTYQNNFNGKVQVKAANGYGCGMTNAPRYLYFVVN